MRHTIGQQDHISLLAHLLALQEERDKFDQERDRRYAEVSVEREKALKIKEVADLRALDLKSEIDKYKEEKANNLREQIGSERGLYATKDDLKALADKMDLAVKPLADFVSSSRGGSAVWVQIAMVVGMAATIVTVVLKF
jgi:hypothetical protein